MVAAKDESLQQRLLQTVLSAIETHVKGGIIPSDALEALKLSPTCGACHKVAKALEFIPAKETIKVLQEIAVEYCVLKKLQDRIVCKGAIGAHDQVHPHRPLVKIHRPPLLLPPNQALPPRVHHAYR